MLSNGGVGILVTVVAVALVFEAAPSPLVFGLALAIFVPDIVLLALRPGSLERPPLPAARKRLVIFAATELKESAQPSVAPPVSARITVLDVDTLTSAGEVPGTA